MFCHLHSLKSMVVPNATKAKTAWAFSNTIPSTCLAFSTSAGIFKQSMRARNRVGIGLSYRPARLHTALRIGSLESIFGLLKSLKIRAQAPPPPQMGGADPIPLCLY